MVTRQHFSQADLQIERFLVIGGFESSFCHVAKSTPFLSMEKGPSPTNC
jgi:hypothetical protein